MENNSSRYYIPHQSGWPILGAIALLALALGSLNLDKTGGLIAFIIGLGGLIFMLTGWFLSVAKESNAGLYNRQMDRTLRWGMFWFLVSELFLFGLIIGSIIYVRFSIIAWLAGQSGQASQLTHYLLWPDFIQHWPLLTPPDAAPTYTWLPHHNLTTVRSTLLINTILLISTTVLLLLSWLYLKKNKRRLTQITLNISILLGLLFFIFQSYSLYQFIKTNFINKSGIYASFLVTFLGLHSLNIAAALILLLCLCFRLQQETLLKKNSVLFDLTVWWWSFLASIGLLGFFCIF